MIELKVQCDCGQKYKFDVEPVNGQMPYAITCPVCGLDGTKKANALLTELRNAPPSRPPIPVVAAATAPAPAPVSVAPSIPAPAPIQILNLPSTPEPAPAPAMASAVAPTPAAAPERPKLRISSSSAHSTAEAAPTHATTASPSIGLARPAAPATPRPMPGISRPAIAQPEKKKGSFAMGLVGALVGAFVGGVIYFLIFSYSGIRLGLMAIGVGFLAGLGARLLGKEGSNELGVIAATLVAASVLGAQYCVAWKWWHESEALEAETSKAEFNAKVEEARKVITAIPNGSDQEIRLYLAKEEVAGTGEAPNLAEVTAEEIKDFRENELPEYRDLAGGKMTRQAYIEKQKAEAAKKEAAKTAEEKDDEDRSFKWFFMILLLSKVNLFSLVAGIGLAYKMSTDAPD